MRKDKVELDEQACARATRSAAVRMDGTIRLAKLLSEDPRRTERVAAQRCRWCYYCTGVAGAAITTQACSLCAVDQHYASTATDLLCAPCATAHGLCRHCGGDLEGQVARKHFLEEVAHA